MELRLLCNTYGFSVFEYFNIILKGYINSRVPKTFMFEMDFFKNLHINLNLVRPVYSLGE